MSQSSQNYDVVICGAGVGGLALAVALGRQGRRVLVIEKHKAEVRVHRGELLQPRTLRILEEWDVLPKLYARGSLPISAMEARNAKGMYLGELNFNRLSETYNYGLAQYYHAIKSAVYEVAKDLVDIRYGTRLVDLERDAWGNVTGVRVAQGEQEEVITANFTVAADGRTSQVRKAIDIRVKMFEYQHQLMGFDLSDIHHLEPRMCAYLTKSGVRVLYPMPGDHARLYVQIQPGEFASIKHQGAQAWHKKLLAGTPGLQAMADYLPDDLSTAQLQGAWSYSAPTWSKARVGLIGDAAHYVHPTAGQGMNAAIIDAWSLAQKLGEAAQGGEITAKVVDQTLMGYDERRQEFAFVGMLCHRLSLFCTSTSTGKQALTSWCLRINRNNEKLQYRVMRNVAGYSSQAFTPIERLRQYWLIPDSLTTLIDERVRG